MIVISFTTTTNIRNSLTDKSLKTMNSSKKQSDPSYYAILIAPVRYDKNLSSSAKLLYAEITSLTNKLGFCYARNSYFEGLFNVSKQSINNWLKNLEDNGYIQRHIHRPKGSKEILNRYITIFEKPIQEILNDNTKHLNSKHNISLKNENEIFKNQSRTRVLN